MVNAICDTCGANADDGFKDCGLKWGCRLSRTAPPPEPEADEETKVPSDLGQETDAGRLLKNALFRLIGMGLAPAAYGSVLADREKGLYATLKYEVGPRQTLEADEEVRDQALLDAAKIAEKYDAKSRCMDCTDTKHIHEEILALRAIPRPAGQDQTDVRLKPEDVEWVVNDIAELGVKIGDQFFFLYKGESLVYGWLDPDPSIAPRHEGGDGYPEGVPMQWRRVGKREFGECAHPINYSDPRLIGSVSTDDGEDWYELPAARPAGQEEG